jgi:GDP-D-mannose dehydratase
MNDTITKCRICDNTDLIDIIKLGEQKITSRFPLKGEGSSVPVTNIDICLCNKCSLVQLRQTTFASELYEHEYGYMSSISNTMRQHLKDYNREVLTKISLNDNDVVVDIGSNDATTLKLYDSSIRRIGVDPTGKQFEKYYDGIELLSDYFTKENFIKNFGDTKCKIVTSISMFYDLPDPIKFAKDIHDVLDDDGIWSCEQSYLLSMLDTNSLDTICHEHLEYYSLTAIKNIADKANLKIIDIKFNSCNGGSFRLYFSKKESKIYNECTALINEILEKENLYGIKDPMIYRNFMDKCDKELKKLTDTIKYINNSNKTVLIYGASTKGNCILQYCDIGPDMVKYAVERNLEKVGKETNTGIEIISEETMRENPPDFLLVLPWHFKKEIIVREKVFLDNGGQFLFYFPTFEIVSNRPKTLVTGCDGFIAGYIKDAYSDHSLYGITSKRNKDNDKDNMIKSYFDMNDYEKLEDLIQTINPDNIIHLAGISSSIEAFDDPFKTLQNNGMLAAKLCDIIHRSNKKIRLFNASSSEVYKGHLNYDVDDTNVENISNTNHLHPYSIAKTTGQQMVQFYRETHDLHFSNGIIFTTQSNTKSDKFLLNKISAHIKLWKNKEDVDPLIVGDLSSFRNIIHPFDVAGAIKTILDNDSGSDYAICSYESHSISFLVEKLYEKCGIELIRGKEENTFYDGSTNKPIMIIETSSNGLDTKQVNIKGYPRKLKDLGWEAKYSVDDILNELA